MVNCKGCNAELLRCLLYGFRSVDRGIDFTTEADLPYGAPFGRGPLLEGGRELWSCVAWLANSRDGALGRRAGEVYV